MEFPLSAFQEGIWLAQQLHPKSPQFNAGGAVRIRAAIDIEALKRARRELVMRHPLLRATIHETPNGGVVQRIAEEVSEAQALKIVDVGRVSDEELRAHVIAENQRPFDLSKEGGTRSTLFRIADDDFVQTGAIHHIVGDHDSAAMARRELLALYAKAVGDKGAGETLPTPTASYANYVHWQRSMLQSPRGEELRRFWLEKLQGASGALDLPTDRPRPFFRVPIGDALQFDIDKETIAGVRALSAGAAGASFFKTLLAAYFVFLHRYTGQLDLTVGVDADARGPEYAGVFGNFINVIVVRVQVSPDQTFRAFLEKVRDSVTEASAHRDYPYVMLVRDLEQSDSRGSIYETDFTLLRQGSFRVNKSQEQGPLSGERLWFPQLTGQMDMRIQGVETADGFVGELKYSTSLFDRSTAARMAAHYSALVRAIVRNPDAMLGDLDLIPEEEHAWLLARSREVKPTTTTSTTTTATTLIDELDAQAERTPDAVALVFGDEQLTYREVLDRANRAACALIARDIRPGAYVALRMHRSAQAVVAMMAVLKAGAAFLPIPTSYPDERVRHILEDALPSLVLTLDGDAESSSSNSNSNSNLNLNLNLKSPLPTLPFATLMKMEGPSGRPDVQLVPQLPAYVIYTSGSTGTPKGAVLSHAGLPSLVRQYRESLRLGPGVQSLQFLSLGFDAALGEIFAAITSGATMIIVPEDKAPADAIIRLIRKHAVTSANLPPGLLRELAVEDVAGLEVVMTGGDTFEESLVRRWSKSCVLVNAYGPTEVTIAATLAELSGGDGKVTIGAPLDGVPAYVVDARFQLAPLGVPGELCLGGLQVAHGYLRRPSLTAEKFVPDPFSGVRGARLYRTGDLVRWLPNGTLDFLGRVDRQVKIRGHRIELGEVESALTSHDAVHEAVVVAIGGVEDRRLVGYVAPPPDESRSIDDLKNADLRGYLAERLPEVMVPPQYVVLDRLPRMPSGKVDRRALPSPPPSATPATSSADFVEPRDELERTIAQIFSRLLDVERVGATSDFFELGGHSLLAMRLASDLEVATGFKAPIGVVVANSSVEALAAALRAGKSDDNDVAVVPLGGTSAPEDAPALYFMPAVTGQTTCFMALSRVIGDRCHAFGLRAAGVDGEAPPLRTIEEMAERHAAELLERGGGGGGPYHLCGWSFGGLVAFETARRLATLHNAQTGLLVLLDARPPGSSTETVLGDARLGDMFARTMRATGEEAAPEALRERAFELFRANVEAERAYRPAESYQGRVLLAMTRASLRAGLDAEWRKLAPNIQVHEIVDADHHSIVRSAEVASLIADAVLVTAAAG